MSAMIWNTVKTPRIVAVLLSAARAGSISIFGPPTGPDMDISTPIFRRSAVEQMAALRVAGVDGPELRWGKSRGEHGQVATWPSVEEALLLLSKTPPPDSRSATQPSR